MILENERQELYNIIKHENFYQYSYTWHIKQNNWDTITTLVQNIIEISKFYELNKHLQDKNLFLEKNLFPIFQEELDLFFKKGNMVYKMYDDDLETTRDINISFYSPLNFYILISTYNSFDSINNDVLKNILNIEEDYSICNNPILKEGIEILNKSLIDPSYFQNFVPFWKKYTKLLLTSNTKANDIEVIRNVAPEKLDDYIKYMVLPGINYEFEKTVLSKKITEFFFNNFEEFIYYNGIIPNPLIWINESKNFLQTQIFLDNISKDHLNYFSLFKNNSIFKDFINNTLFSFSNNKSFSIKKIKHLLELDYNYDHLFKNLKIDKVSNELSNFENFLLILEQRINSNDLLSLGIRILLLFFIL